MEFLCGIQSKVCLVNWKICLPIDKSLMELVASLTEITKIIYASFEQAENGALGLIQFWNFIGYLGKSSWHFSVEFH